MWENVIPTVTTIILATIIGGVIGMERTIHGRPAGFRTHILVCLSSAILTLVGTFVLHAVDVSMGEIIRADPLRSAQGIMTGIGFLGAGVIMKEGLTVRGLTTAASIWLTAALGIVIGLEFYVVAILTTVATIVVLVLFRYLERITPTVYYRKLNIVVSDDFDLNKFRRMLLALNVKAKSISYSFTKGKQRYAMTIIAKNRDSFETLAHLMKNKNPIISFNLQFDGDVH